MGKGSGKRATRARVADVSAATREDVEQLKRAATRRLAKLEKDLAAAHKAEERHRSRLATASAEADRIRGEIAGLLRHASEPAVSGARKVRHAAGELLEDAADAVSDAATGMAHAAGSVRDAAGSVVGAARRSVKTKPSAAEAPAAAKPAAATPPAPAKSATPRKGRARKATPPVTGPGNG